MDFYSILSRYYDDLFPPNPRQILFLTRRLPARGKVLDVGAGTGGYAAALAAKGAMVEALEIESMVPYLQKSAHKHGFTAWDMGMEQVQQLEAGSYGLVYCIGNTLVHLENQDQVTSFLRNCRRLLLPGGTLILQIVNYDRIFENNLTELPVIAVPDQQLTLIREYVIGNDTVQFITRLSQGNRQWVSEARLLALKQSELERCLSDAGFKDICFLGNFDGLPWETSSSATIAVAKA